MGDLAEARIITADVSDYLERAYGRDQVRIIIGYLALQFWSDIPKVPLVIVGRDAARLRVVLEQAFPGRQKVETAAAYTEGKAGAKKLQVALSLPMYIPWEKLSTIWPEFQRAVNTLRKEYIRFKELSAETVLQAVRIPMADHLYEVIPYAWASWATLCSGECYVGQVPDLAIPRETSFVSLDAIPLDDCEMNGSVLYLPGNARIDTATRNMIGRLDTFYTDEGEKKTVIAIPYRMDLDRLFRRAEAVLRPGARLRVVEPAAETPDDETPDVFRVK